MRERFRFFYASVNGTNNFKKIGVIGKEKKKKFLNKKGQKRQDIKIHVHVPKKKSRGSLHERGPETRLNKSRPTHFVFMQHTPNDFNNFTLLVISNHGATAIKDSSASSAYPNSSRLLDPEQCKKCAPI